MEAMCSLFLPRATPVTKGTGMGLHQSHKIFFLIDRLLGERNLFLEKPESLAKKNSRDSVKC